MFGQNKPSQLHENDTMGMREPTPVSVSEHLQSANGFADHIINSFSHDHQTEILLQIQKRMIEYRRNQLGELELQIKALKEQYEKIVMALNVIS